MCYMLIPRPHESMGMRLDVLCSSLNLHTCSLPHSLHLSQPTQSMIRDMFLKCVRNSFCNGERISPDDLKERRGVVSFADYFSACREKIAMAGNEPRGWGGGRSKVSLSAKVYTHGHRPSAVVMCFQ